MARIKHRIGEVLLRQLRIRVIIDLRGALIRLVIMNVSPPPKCSMSFTASTYRRGDALIQIRSKDGHLTCWDPPGIHIERLCKKGVIAKCVL